MGQGSRGHWDSPLGSVPRLPNHNACEMGELTQTGEQGTRCFSFYHPPEVNLNFHRPVFIHLQINVLFYALEPFVPLNPLC